MIQTKVSEDPRLKKRTLVMLAGLVAVILTIITGVTFGAVEIPFTEFWAAMTQKEITENYQILFQIRIPRVIVGALTGMNLALAGCILQGILRNPLADPGIIGVSAGAGVAAMLVMVLYPEQTMLVPMVAFLGALIATGLVFLLSWEQGIHPLRMILAGVAVGAFFGGAMSAIMVFHSDKIQGTVNWLAGGFQGRSWEHVKMILPYSLIGVVGTMIGSVGLVVPHMIRMLVGSDFEYLLPCSALFGAALVVGADTVARTAFSPIEVPVGIFMAFLGAPFFLYLLKKGLRKE